MFSVIKKKKASHWFDKCESICWHDAIQIEDTMTALFFDALIGLSGNTVKFIFQKLNCHSKCDFSWLSDDNYESIPWMRFPYQSTHIEPDRVLVDYNNKYTIVVEVKKEDALHSVEQLISEVEAVELAYQNHTIILMILGGSNIFSTCSETLKRMNTRHSLCSSSWVQLINSIRETSNALKDRREQRILNYLLDNFEWFGISSFLGFQLDSKFDSKSSTITGLPKLVKDKPVELPAPTQLLGFVNMPVIDQSCACNSINGWKLI